MGMTARRFAGFAEAYAMALTEELSGAPYFGAIASVQDDPRHGLLLRVLELIEIKTARAMLPGARALGLALPEARVLEAGGVADAGPWLTLNWDEITGRMAGDYPAYLEEFSALIAAAPEALKPVARLVHDHEVAIIDFARAEHAGGDGTEFLLAYLAKVDAFLAAEATTEG
jgi:hypothetical protein